MFMELLLVDCHCTPVAFMLSLVIHSLVTKAWLVSLFFPAYQAGTHTIVKGCLCVQACVSVNTAVSGGLLGYVV